MSLSPPSLRHLALILAPTLARTLANTTQPQQREAQHTQPTPRTKSPTTRTRLRRTKEHGPRPSLSAYAHHTDASSRPLVRPYFNGLLGVLVRKHWHGRLRRRTWRCICTSASSSTSPAGSSSTITSYISSDNVRRACVLSRARCGLTSAVGHGCCVRCFDHLRHVHGTIAPAAATRS